MDTEFILVLLAEVGLFLIFVILCLIHEGRY